MTETRTRPRTAARPFLAVLLLLAFAPVAWAQGGERGGGEHMLWQVSSQGGVEGYLIGSIHVMREDAYPLDPVFERAFAKSDVLAFELNFDSANARMAGLIRRLGTYQRGKTLKEALSPETYSMLTQALEQLSLPAGSFQRYEPWFVALTIPSLQMMRAGYRGETGIDRHFFDKAKEAGKQIVALETAEYQMRLFDELSPELQEAFLRYGLAMADRRIELMGDMVAAWKRGDADAFERMILEEWRARFPAIYDRLIIQRNRNWIPKIDRLFAGPGRAMIIVGAAHVVGENGLVNLLERRGYEVEQL